MEKAVVINENDNVAVAIEPLNKGEKITVNDKEITLIDDVPMAHKIAIKNINKDENVVKYGYAIGHATQDILMGSHIHTHNLKTNLSGEIDYTYNKTQSADFVSDKTPTFMGYKRENGIVGIRNEIWIIPTVGCVNSTAQNLAKQANKMFGDKVDGVFAFTHNMGCSQLTDDFKRTQQILKGVINNPNAAGVLVLSLGCENNNLDSFMPVLGDYNKDRVKFLVTQDVEDEYEDGLNIIKQLVDYASNFKREEVSCNNLKIGFKCGGSDGFSGITANPLCGKINDKVVSLGGSTVLTEVPEMFGGETILMNRAINENVFNKVVNLINSFKEYYIRYGQTIYENPSPGNKKGGISTLEDKSLGCIQKGGTAPVVDVLTYGEMMNKNGLNLLIGPGNDQISCTNLVASGVQMILFTTGRGNPFGSPVPTVKISSNTQLFNKKSNWIDFNAGKIVEGENFDTLTNDLFNYILDVANGKNTKNEINDFREISVFRDGVIL